MTAQMFLVADNRPGRLWIMPHPDPADLPGQMNDFRDAGMDHLVSMLAPAEAAELGLGEEAAQCEAVGISFHAYPIPDFGLPDQAAFAALTQRIWKWLSQGQSVGVHCRAGIGRSGMVTAGVLILKGQKAEDAIKTVSAARNQQIPDTVEQGNFLTSFAQHLT